MYQPCVRRHGGERDRSKRASGDAQSSTPFLNRRVRLAQLQVPCPVDMQSAPSAPQSANDQPGMARRSQAAWALMAQEKTMHDRDPSWQAGLRTIWLESGASGVARSMARKGEWGILMGCHLCARQGPASRGPLRPPGQADGLTVAGMNKTGRSISITSDHYWIISAFYRKYALTIAYYGLRPA